MFEDGEEGQFWFLYDYSPGGIALMSAIVGLSDYELNILLSYCEFLLVLKPLDLGSD